MSADLSKESKNSSCLLKPQAGLKPIKRTKFYNEYPVESACSDCLPVSKIQSCTASRIRECDSLKSHESQLSLKKKIEELRSSFFAVQDSNVDDTLEASHRGLISQISCQKNAAEIHSNCFVKSKSLLTFPEITFKEFQFSSSLKQEQCSVQKLVFGSQKSENSVSKTVSNCVVEPQENNVCSKKIAEKICHCEFSVQEHSLFDSSHKNVEHFFSAEKILQESGLGASSSFFSSPQDPDTHCKKKLKKSHSFEHLDRTSHPKSFRKENWAPNSSVQSSKENSIKTCSVLTSKPQDLHCRFKKQFNQLHSSFFPEQESCSASLEKKIPGSLSSDQKSYELIRTNTLESSADEVSESMKSVTEGVVSKKKPTVAETCALNSFVLHSSDDNAGPKNTESIDPQPGVTFDEFIFTHTQAAFKARSHAMINPDSDAETAGTSRTDMTVKNNQQQSTSNRKGGMCVGNNFTSDFSTIPECKINHDSDISEVDSTNLFNQVNMPVDNPEKTTPLAKVSRKTKIKKINVARPELDLSLDSQQNGNEGELIVAAELTSSRALCLPVEKSNRLSSQRNCDVKLNLKQEQADLNHHLAVVSEKKKEKSFPQAGTSSKLANINPGFEPCLLALMNSGNFQPTKNERKRIQPKNLEASVNDFKVPLPLVSEPRKNVSFQKNCDPELNEQDSNELALLLADITEEFFSQLGSTPKKKTDEENFASKPSSTPCEIPYLTIKKPGLANQTCSDRSLVQLLIVDLLRVTPTFRRNHYLFHNLVVHRVDVFGVVTGVRPVGDEKVLYEVDDGSGTISCMHRTTRTKARLKKLTDFLHRRGNDETFNQTGDTIMDESSVERSSERENAFKQLKTCTENQLAASDEELFHKIGDTIHAKGVLYDYRDTISFYTYNIRKVKNIAEETDRYFQMAVLYNSTYPKIIKGFKT